MNFKTPERKYEKRNELEINGLDKDGDNIRIMCVGHVTTLSERLINTL